MVDRSLPTSLWADKRNGWAEHTQYLGNWICPTCGFSNFQRRTECYRCASKPTSTSLQNKSDAKNGHGLSRTILSPRGLHQQGVINDYKEVNMLRPGSSESIAEGHIQQTHKVKKENQSLYTSRWARRESSRIAVPHNVHEVWTKVVPKVNTVSLPSSNNVSPPIFMTPDLGLPYEVQHYILAMMQRILEEACFDFASRWTPKALNEKSWTCSEAVELSTWRKFLPSTIPTNAIVPVKNYSLENALLDAVRIRNSAVHRHLCDNVEIRRMTLQAQDLMFMFSDIKRQAKFHRLHDELVEWDITAQHDLQASRNKLQVALQEISESPINDMDWTPNAVSLEEITDDTESNSGDGDYYVDAMEVD